MSEPTQAEKDAMYATALKTIASLRKQLDAAQQRADYAERALAQNDAELQARMEEQVAAQQRIADIEKLKNDTLAQYDGALAGIEGMPDVSMGDYDEQQWHFGFRRGFKHRSDICETISTLEQRIAELRAENARLQQRIATSDAALIEITKRHIAAEQQIAAMERSLNGDGGVYEGTYQDWVDRAFAAEANLEAAQQQIAGYEHEQKLMRSDLAGFVTDCSTPTFQLVRNALEQIAALTAELKVERELLASADETLALIPECPAHGRCHPYMQIWIRTRTP